MNKKCVDCDIDYFNTSLNRCTVCGSTLIVNFYNSAPSSTTRPTLNNSNSNNNNAYALGFVNSNATLNLQTLLESPPKKGLSEEALKNLKTIDIDERGLGPQVSITVTGIVGEIIGIPAKFGRLLQKDETLVGSIAFADPIVGSNLGILNNGEMVKGSLMFFFFFN